MFDVSVVCSLQDRSNSNTLINQHGHVIYVDFSCLLGLSPGKSKWGSESSAFKWTAEFIELMNGRKSLVFRSFVKSIVAGFLVARKCMSAIVAIVSSFAKSGLTCFSTRTNVLENLKARFFPELSDSEAIFRIKKLIRC